MVWLRIVLLYLGGVICSEFVLYFSVEAVHTVQYCTQNSPNYLVILVGIFTTRVISDELPPITE